jgi:hypothetical protein
VKHKNTITIDKTTLVKHKNTICFVYRD